MNAYTTDFAAIGLPDPSPFDCLSRPRATPAVHKVPGKRGPRKQGKSIQLPGSREKKILRVNPTVYMPTRADSDKTARIVGKANGRRSA